MEDIHLLLIDNKTRIVRPEYDKKGHLVKVNLLVNGPGTVSYSIVQGKYDRKVGGYSGPILYVPDDLAEVIWIYFSNPGLWDIPLQTYVNTVGLNLYGS